jgi:phosphodiesterase/alkaline phosphatase D-like protein
MVKTYDQTPFKVAVLLGDNIYPNGDIKKLGKTHFEDPYQGLIRNHVKFVAALGNHDYRQGHQNDEMRYFKMPKDYYQYSDGPVDFFILNTIEFVDNPTQQAWLKQALAHSQARWKIVAAHHPVYSSGKHGKQTFGLRRVLEPILVKHHADLYLAGHDHDYERFEPIQGVNYIVSGGGGSYLYDFKKIAPHSLVRIKTIHFLLFSATEHDLWVKAINRNGETVDCAHWHKDKTGTATQKG